MRKAWRSAIAPRRKHTTMKHETQLTTKPKEQTITSGRRGEASSRSARQRGKFGFTNNTTPKALGAIFKLQHKILGHPCELALWQQGEAPPPISGEIQPTDQCNNNCSFCHFRHLHKEGQSLSYEEMTNILTQIKDEGQKAIVFSGGGEPLKNNETPGAVEFANKIGLDVGFITNGQLITPSTADILVKNCMWVRVSLSATTRETFKIIRGVDNFEITLEGIKTLLSAKKKMKSDVTIGLQWIYTQQDPIINLIKFIRHWASGKGIDYIQLLCEQSFDESRLRQQRGLAKIAQYLQNKQQKDPAIIYSKADDLRLPNFGRDYNTCEGHWFTNAVGADGKIYICCNLIGQEEFAFGNLKTETFKDAWYSQKRRDIAASIDVERCMHLCKHHEVNKLLGKLKQPVQHRNFL